MSQAIFGCLWVLILGVSGSYAVLTGQSDWLYPPLAGMVAVTAIATRRLAYKPGILAASSLFVGLIAIAALVRGDLLGPPMFVIVKVLISVFAVGVMSGNRTFDSLRALTKVVEGVTAFSFVTWVLANVAPSLLRYGFAHDIGGDYLSLFGVAFFQGNSLAKFGFIRNQSVFWEPGVFAVVLVMVFSLKVYVLRRRDHLWIYCMGVLSSASMGGVLIFVPVFVHSILGQRLRTARGQDRLMRALLCASFAAMALISLVGDSASVLLSGLFGRDLSNDSSVQTRLMDLVYGFRASLDAPWLGHGPNFDSFYALTLLELGMSKASYMGGITNSLVSMAYQFGLPFLCLYVIVLWRSQRRWFGALAPLFFLVWFGCLMLEPLFASVFVLVLLFWAGHARIGSAPRPAGDLASTGTLLT